MVGAYFVTESVGPIIVFVWGYEIDVDIFVAADVTMSSMGLSGISIEKASLAICIWPALF